MKRFGLVSVAGRHSRGDGAMCDGSAGRGRGHLIPQPHLLVAELESRERSGLEGHSWQARPGFAGSRSAPLPRPAWLEEGGGTVPYPRCS